MRDKFSELIKQGVARFEYTPIAPSTPEQDLVCRQYNNIWAIPSDTHMHYNEETGERYITGHMVGIKERWDCFVYSHNWGAVTFKTTGYWCLCDFLQKNGLCGKHSTLNGDNIYLVTPIPEEAGVTGVACPGCPDCVTTSESKIPQRLNILAVDGMIARIHECFDGKKNLYEVSEALNNSRYVHGNQWTVNGDKLVCQLGNKTYIL